MNTVRRQHFGVGGLAASAARNFLQRSMPAYQEGMTAIPNLPGALSVVKNRGGNWLTDSIPNAMKSLKTVPVEGVRNTALLPQISREQPLNAWIDGPLSNYIQNDFAATTDPVRLRADRIATAALVAKNKAEKQIYKAQKRLEMMVAKGSTEGLPPEEWQGVLERTKAAIDNMQTEADAAYERAVAKALPVPREQLVHVNNATSGLGLMLRRKAQGPPRTDTAISNIGSAWERSADRVIVPRTANEIRDKTGWTGPGLEKALAVNPWMEKLPPEAPVYDIYGNAPRALGLDHVVDELRNALNKDSGLPAHLQIAPDTLKTYGIEKAIDHVANINDWRAQQALQLSQDEMKHFPVLKEYPSGFKWIELKLPETLPEGYNYEPSGTSGYHWNYPDPQTGAKMWTPIHPNTGILKEALNREGVNMQHCVDGYCDDVLSGRSRIFSLRDAKGEPHVTVEVVPGKKLTEADLPDSVRDQLADFDGTQEEFEALVQRSLVDKQIKDRIHQIKGKNNQKPADKYLPMVQDLVKNPRAHGFDFDSWSDVGDLKNAGLVHRSSLDGAEINKASPDQQYFTQDEIDALYDDVRRRISSGEKFSSGGKAPGMAAGGVVRKQIRTVAELSDIIASLEAA